MALDRILLDHPGGRRMPVVPADVFYLPAESWNFANLLGSPAMPAEAACTHAPRSGLGGLIGCDDIRNWNIRR